ncbi:MAG: glycosyltransferase [Geobacteraceae bacterium]|nr:glycosyltransferase [Geobacteraceae bacterium]
MIRILHTIDTTGPGGAETVFIDLIKGMDCRKFEPVVAIRGKGWVCDELVKYGITPLFVNSKGALNIEYLQKLIQITYKYDIDIVQSHLLGSNLYCSLASMICGVPVVSTFHGFVDMNIKERFPAIKSKIINRGSARLVFVSEGLRKYYVEQKGFSDRKSVTISNGVNTSLFKPQRDDSIRKKLGLVTGDVLVGTVGNIRASKGYVYLLKAAKVVIGRNPQVHFAIAGERSGSIYENLLDLRKNLGLDNHFFFLGFEPEVPRFLNNLDVFVLPSVSEGFSISTIEAMACGVPVIVTRSGGPEEIVENGLTGIIVPVRDHYSLAQAVIDSIGKNRDDNNAMSAMEACKKKFSINKMISNYQEIYINLMEKN